MLLDKKELKIKLVLIAILLFSSSTLYANLERNVKDENKDVILSTGDFVDNSYLEEVKSKRINLDEQKNRLNRLISSDWVHSLSTEELELINKILELPLNERKNKTKLDLSSYYFLGFDDKYVKSDQHRKSIAINSVETDELLKEIFGTYQPNNSLKVLENLINTPIPNLTKNELSSINLYLLSKMYSAAKFKLEAEDILIPYLALFKNGYSESVSYAYFDDFESELKIVGRNVTEKLREAELRYLINEMEYLTSFISSFPGMLQVSVRGISFKYDDAHPDKSKVFKDKLKDSLSCIVSQYKKIKENISSYRKIDAKNRVINYKSDYWKFTKDFHRSSSWGERSSDELLKSNDMFSVFKLHVSYGRLIVAMLKAEVGFFDTVPVDTSFHRWPILSDLEDVVVDIEDYGKSDRYHTVGSFDIGSQSFAAYDIINSENLSIKDYEEMKLLSVAKYNLESARKNNIDGAILNITEEDSFRIGLSTTEYNNLISEHHRLRAIENLGIMRKLLETDRKVWPRLFYEFTRNLEKGKINPKDIFTTENEINLFEGELQQGVADEEERFCIIDRSLWRSKGRLNLIVDDDRIFMLSVPESYIESDINCKSVWKGDNFFVKIYYFLIDNGYITN